MRVLELSDREEAAAFCGKLLARWGAEVIKVERPGRETPGEALDRYLNGGKRRVALDRSDAGARAALDRLAAGCDVLITDAPAHAVEQLRLLELGGDDEGPRVRASITPFGLSGPRRDWRATASTLLALGGYTYLSGDPGRTPLTLPGQYPYYQAGSFAYIAVVAAHLRAVRDPSTPPARIEVSAIESVAALHQFTFVMYRHGGVVRSRHGNRWENLHPTTLYRCADGWWAQNVLPNFWEAFALMLGRPELATDPRFATNADRMEHADELDEIVLEATADWPMERILREGQETWRVPVGTATSLQQALDDRHLGERGFWRPLSGDGELRTAGSPYRFVGEKRPPELPPEAPGASAEPPPIGPRTEPAAAVLTAAGDGPLPLAGVRIVDLTRIWSGPLVTRILGDLGAEVIKVEAHGGRGPAAVPRALGGYYPGGDPGERPWNRQSLFNKLSRNKRSVVLNLKHERGHELFLRLVSESDVVIENFSARAMPGLDLGYERLREANERVIYLSMPAFGVDGPHRDYIGLGPSIEPLTGLTVLMGYSDEEPRVTSMALTDAISGVAGAAAVVTALERRVRTGEGAFVDLSQHEAGVAMFGEFFIERQLAGEEPSRAANAHARYAPHGVYRCAGEDEWIAIAARDDAEWRTLSACASSGWDADRRFATVEQRLAQRAALDDAIERWTVGRERFALMAELQEAGVPAGAVLSAPEVLGDVHLTERGFWVELDEPDGGPQLYDGSPLRFDGQRHYEAWTPAPGLGADNEWVLGNLLGLDDAEIADLYAQGVIADRPPG